MTVGKNYIGVGTGVLITNEKGELLMMKQAKNTRRSGGKWEFCGGQVEFGETAVNAITREVKEELSIEIEVLRLLCFVDDIREDEGQHWAGPTYLAKIVEGIPQNLEPLKCDEIGWFSLEEVKSMNIALTVKYGINAYENC